MKKREPTKSHFRRGDYSRQGDFLIYCTELFSRYDVWDYIYTCFETLHTTGANYIEDINEYIEVCAGAEV